MAKAKVVITVKSGMVTSVNKDDKKIEVIVHDYDTDGIPDDVTEVDKDGARFILSEW